MQNTNEINNNPKTKEEAQRLLNQLMQTYDQIENAMTDLALEFELHLSLGDYGYGRYLIHEDDHWSGKDRGTWITSSEGC